MQMLSHIYDTLKPASLLVVFLVLSLAVPMSAHVSMPDHKAADQLHINMGHAQDVAVAKALSDGAKSTHNYEHTDCCDAGICGSVTLTDSFSFPEALDPPHNHVALFAHQMASIGQPRLIRPPRG